MTKISNLLSYGLSTLNQVTRRARRTAGSVRRRFGNLVGNLRWSLDQQGSTLPTARERRRAFQDVYKRNLWGHDGKSKFFSGIGSRGPAADYYVDQMAALLRKDTLEMGRPLKIVDLGCGDFEVAKALLKHLPEATYIGCDIVPNLIDHHSRIYANERITFKVVDIVSDEMPDGDVCLVRQVFQHLPNADIAKALKKLKYKFIYITEGHPVERVGAINPDKGVGFDVRFDWRTGKGRGVELAQPPFSVRAEEMFRIPSSPSEIVVTERIYGLLDKQGADQTHMT